MPDATTRWMTRLARLMPADGHFTQEIADQAGGIPLDLPPLPPNATRKQAQDWSARQAHEGNTFRGRAPVMVETKIVLAVNDRNLAKGKDDQAGIAEAQRRIDYWREVEDWVQRIPRFDAK